MNGALDLVFPLFDALDASLRLLSLHPVIRLALWGALSGAAAMLCYRLLSRQESIRTQKAKVKETRRALSAAGDAEPDEAVRLALTNVGEAFRLLAMVIVPSLLSAIPVILVLFWLGNVYAYETSDEGDVVDVEIEPPLGSVEIRMDSKSALESDSGRFDLTYLRDEALTVSVAGDVVYEGKVDSPPVPVVHKHRWWNYLVGNPAGYLPPDSPIEAIRFHWDRALYVQFLPRWMSTWEFTYFLSLFVAALLLKFRLRIE